MTAVDLLIHGGTVVTGRSDGAVFNAAAIAVLGDSILDIGPADVLQPRFQAARTIDAQGQLIFPGLVDTHTHLYQTPRLLDLGVTVSLGADGAASNNSQDMLEALKVGALLPKVAARDPAIFTAADAVRIATSGGAAAMGRTDFGSLEPGKRADLFIFDPHHAKSIPVHDPVSTLVYSSGEVNIRSTIVGGRVVLDDGRIVGVDQEAILCEAQTLAEQLSELAGTRARLAGRWAQKRTAAAVV